MKNVFLLLLAVLLNSVTFAQIPNQISWQGILQDSEGELLNGNYDLSVKIYDVATGGTALWSETHTNKQINEGFTNIILGSINAINLDFDVQYWLEIQIGTSTPLSRIKLTSVPYALYAKKAPNEIQGESLILRDSDGNMRMRLNPDEGIFEMFDDEEELWYSMQVNSPFTQKTYYDNGSRKEVFGDMVTTYFADGTVTIEQGNTKNEYNSDGFMVSSTTTTVAGNAINKNIKLYSGTSGHDTPTSESNVQNYVDRNGNTVEETERVYYDYEGNEKCFIKKKEINGVLKKWEKWIDGKKVEEWEDQEYQQISRYYDNNENLKETRTYYPESNSNIVESGYDITGFQQSSTQFTFDGKVQVNGPAYLTNGLNVTSGNANLFNTHSTYLTVYESAGFNKGITAGQTSTFNNVLISGKIKSEGDVETYGSLVAQGPKPFKIEHPDDDTKYLLHAAMESNEVLNTYTGNVFTDDDGYATVTLPDYFSLINSGADIRYQLTIIGNTFARAIVYSEIDDNEFIIKTDEPNIKVSWLVISKRNDQYMQFNPFYDVIDK